MGNIYDDGRLRLTETTGALGSPALSVDLQSGPVKRDVKEVTELHEALHKWLEDVAPL